MTNEELKNSIEEMLRSGSVDNETIFLLQDASLHVALKLGVSLSALQASYVFLAESHKPIELLARIAGAAGVKDLDALDILEIGGEKDKTTEEEKARLNDLLKDIKFDL